MPKFVVIGANIFLSSQKKLEQESGIFYAAIYNVIGALLLSLNLSAVHIIFMPFRNLG